VPKKRPEKSWDRCARELGTSIQRRRTQLGLSQENVAYAAGISRYTFQKLEKGESQPGVPSNPSLRNVMAVAQVLGTSLDSLLPEDWPELRSGLPPRE
jgi:Predicted transcriptional regulators